MRSTTRIMAAVALTAVAVAMAGCGGSDETTPVAAPKSTTPTTSAPSTSPSVADSPGADAAGFNFTKQGTKLKFGEKAIVQYKYGHTPGVIGVTALGVKKGTAADLALLKMGDRVKGLVPWYITFKVTNESGAQLDFSSIRSTHGLLGDGTQAQGVIMTGKFAPCEDNGAKQGFTSKGSSYTTCMLSLAGAGSTVSGADYSANDSDVNIAANTDYSDDPITWK
jgi:hypothetical protein